MNVQPHFLSTSALVGSNGNAIIEATRRQGTRAQRLHRTSGKERKHRDGGFIHGTRVAPRNEAGEIPD